MHRRAVTHQRIKDKKERAPQLVEHGKVANALLVGKAALAELGNQSFGEWNGRRRILHLQLLVDYRVELGHVMVIDLVQESRLHHLAVTVTKLLNSGPAPQIQLLNTPVDLRSKGVKPGLEVHCLACVARRSVA